VFGLFSRFFEIDLERSPNCGGKLKIIAAILEAPLNRADADADAERCPASLCCPAKFGHGAEKPTFECPIRQPSDLGALGVGLWRIRAH